MFSVAGIGAWIAKLAASRLAGFLWHNAKYIAAALILWWAYHQGVVAQRTANELAAARSTIALLEAVSRRNAEAAMAAQHSAVTRGDRADALQVKVETYARELLVRRNEVELLEQHNDETVADYEKRLQAAAKASGKEKVGVRCGCTLSRRDLERLREIH